MRNPIAARLTPALALLAAFLAFGAMPAALADERYTIDTPLDRFVDISAEELERFYEEDGHPGMKGTGAAMVAVGKKYDINPIYVMAHAAHESGWGRSDLATYKKNWFGYGAFDRCPYECAVSYPSHEAGIEGVMQKVREDYLNADGRFNGGSPTLKGMNVSYATDKNWKYGISSIMNRFQDWKNEQPVSAPPPETASTGRATDLMPVVPPGSATGTVTGLLGQALLPDGFDLRGPLDAMVEDQRITLEELDAQLADLDKQLALLSGTEALLQGGLNTSLLGRIIDFLTGKAARDQKKLDGVLDKIETLEQLAAKLKELREAMAKGRKDEAGRIAASLGLSAASVGSR